MSHKWKFDKNKVSVGTLVLIKDENLPSTKWSTGRITEIFPGTDEKYLECLQMRQILDGSELLGFQKLFGRRVDPNVLKSVGYPSNVAHSFPVILIVADELWTCVIIEKLRDALLLTTMYVLVANCLTLMHGCLEAWANCAQVQGLGHSPRRDLDSALRR
ncbi:hypothetical protein TNCV_2524762 [Trichonephila clavipes]|nr:hypothetical protein TNCV_2524762 [Trichonephila clavipes]